MFVRLLVLQRHYRLIAVDLSKQKKLDADSRAIQQTTYKSQVRTILERSKQTILEFHKRTAKVLQIV